MNERELLLRAILSEPADDTPRLIFADWLDEHGEPGRAEFVRVQCELARHPQQTAWLAQMPVESWTGDEEEGRLLVRLDGLIQRERVLGRDKWQWLRAAQTPECWPHLYKWVCDHKPVWRRGFVEALTLSAADWLAHHEAVYWHPDQRVPCPKCETRGEWRNTQMRYYGGFLCKQCGTHTPPGTVPRPFVPTAQPVREVTLADRNPVEWLDSDMQMVYIPELRREWDADDLWARFPDAESVAHAALRDVWPGITFHLPG